ncbi:MAG TPA: CocE/NonD family hydrolase [Acidimicrobiales bacterium]|nr:CocE/NonD family hydrolase [Acidimicrobiales bacterium]
MPPSPTRRTAGTTRTTGRLVAAAALAAVPLAVATPPAGASPSTPAWVLARPVTFTTTALDFEVTVGPAGGPTITCNVDADLRVPVTATADHPAPAILTSNGFGGSKSSTGATASNASYAEQYAGQGYVTLSYSGLGFGKSTCPIELDSPAYDGAAARVLVGFLGGDTSAAHTAFTPDQSGATPGTWSGTVTAPPVLLDHCDHAGHCGAADPHDPRVGMIGGSYGGENQFAAAAVDPRIDTIVPQITWNDLVYSLAPNNQGPGGATAPVTQSAGTPGLEKLQWTSAFFALGMAQVAMGNGADTPLVPYSTGPQPQTCPDFNPQVCVAKATIDATGYPDPATVDFLHTASAGQYLDAIHIPVFLSQGEDDTLFTLREAIATYQALRAQGTPVKMLWQQWGHSGGPAAGEADATTPVPTLYDDLRYSAWFARYLRGDTRADTGPAFEYLAPWVADDGSATTPDVAQYLGADSFPVGSPSTLYLSGGDATGTGALVADPAAVQAGDATFTATPAPTSTTGTDGVTTTPPQVDAPGTFAAFTSPALTAPDYLVGSPTLTVHLSAPTFAASQAGGPAGELVVVAKLFDVAPDGTKTLVYNLVAPTRVLDVTVPVTIHLPAVVHEFATGHALQLVLASADAAYKGGDAAGPVSIVDNPTAPNTFVLPLTDGTGLNGISSDAQPPAATPEVGLPAALAVAGFGGGLWVLRRRRRTA